MEIIHENISETVKIKSISEKIEKNNSKALEEKLEKIVEITTDQKSSELDAKSRESAALTAGRNAVSCIRSGKKPSSAFPGTKVRQACLKIPLVYSHRSQRLPPIVSTGSVERTLLGENSVVKMAIESENDETNNSEKIDKCETAYYFPSVDSEKWLCVFQKE